jgi:hypothetical protein
MAAALLATNRARPMTMRGRELRGSRHVPGDVLSTGGELARWVGLGAGRARSLASA